MPALADLAVNLRSGVRLAFFRRVAPTDFRIGARELVVLIVVSALFDIGIDGVRHGVDGRFSWLGVSGEAYAAAAVLLMSALLSMLYRRPSLALELPTIAFAAYPSIQALRLAALLGQRAFPDAAVLAGWADDLALLWTVAIFVRTVAAALVPAPRLRWLHAIVGAAVLLAPLRFGYLFAPGVSWWSLDAAAPQPEGAYPNPASEPVLEAQRLLLDEALGGLQEPRPGVADLYFVGFAAAGIDALRSDVLSAVQVMDERWATAGRSVTLINHRASVLEQPMATVTNLRETLAELQQLIDPDEDVVMLYIAGKGSRGGRVDVALPPFELAALTPAGVRRMLDDAGIRWRIVVVSACYSGAWLEALADDSTLVLTATDATVAGAGCRLDDDGSVFGKALFGAALADAETIEAAFALARRRVVAGSGADSSAPGLPQIAVGQGIAGKLKELERGRAARRASRSV